MATSFQDFRALVETSPDAVSLIDKQGEILYGSASSTKLFGFLPEELVGRNCLDLVHPEDRRISSQALRELVASPPGPLRCDARMLHKDGNYSWVESTMSNLLFQSEVNAIVVHQRDINSQRLVELERQSHAEEMSRSNLRLKEFAYTAAHDLREPLNTISLCTEMLVEKVQMDANSRQIAKFIVEGAVRMSALVNDLLSFASTGIAEPLKEVDLQDAVAQAQRNLTVAIEASGAAISVDCLPVVQGNHNHLVRLFQNLISNALKYRSLRAVEIRITAARRGPDWLIRIKDNGIGIAPENQDRIFSPFTRLVNHDIPGTGLGLAVCKQIVEGMSGSLWVESERGAGSTFCFTIPASPVQPVIQ